MIQLRDRTGEANLDPHRAYVDDACNNSVKHDEDQPPFSYV